MRRGVTDGGLLFGNVEVNTRRHLGNLKVVYWKTGIRDGGGARGYFLP